MIHCRCWDVKWEGLVTHQHALLWDFSSYILEYSVYQTRWNIVDMRRIGLLVSILSIVYYAKATHKIIIKRVYNIACPSIRERFCNQFRSRNVIAAVHANPFTLTSKNLAGARFWKVAFKSLGTAVCCIFYVLATPLILRDTLAVVVLFSSCTASTNLYSELFQRYCIGFCSKQPPHSYSTWMHPLDSWTISADHGF